MESIKELINRRRNQILVNSCIYYRLNKNIISDQTFDKWSKELAELQLQYPDIAKECVYHEYFEEFDGSSGFNLPYHLPDIVGKAHRLLKLHKKFGNT